MTERRRIRLELSETEDDGSIEFCTNVPVTLETLQALEDIGRAAIAALRRGPSIVVAEYGPVTITDDMLVGPGPPAAVRDLMDALAIANRRLEAIRQAATEVDAHAQTVPMQSIVIVREADWRELFRLIRSMRS